MLRAEGAECNPWLTASLRAKALTTSLGTKVLATSLVVLLAVACGGDEDGQITVAAPQGTATGALQRVEATVAASATTAPVETETAPVVEPTEADPVEEATATMVATETPPEPTTTAEPAVPAAQPLSAISLTPVLQGLDSPTYLTHAGDERLFITEQQGRIQVVQDSEVAAEPFLDIVDRVGSNSNEQGLLSVAFHPEYASNGYFFVNYTDNNGHTVVSRYQVSEDANRADVTSEQRVLSVQQPFGNHNGGHIFFGPDGYLYIGMGDGGSGGDPQNNGQNPETLLGSILRLDVDNVTAEAPYAIPPDNPFVEGGGAPEAWAFGVRNPWRMSIDPLTNVFYVADVGQNQYEEVHALALEASAGANLGWNIMEGLQCYNAQDCDTSGLVLPVVEYSHEQGGCSVTGGTVYRGSEHEALAGHYFFGDYCSGFIWSLYQDEVGEWTTGQGALVTVDGQITSFGVDVVGEVYVVTQGGTIFGIGD